MVNNMYKYIIVIIMFSTHAYSQALVENSKEVYIPDGVVVTNQIRSECTQTGEWYFSMSSSTINQLTNASSKGACTYVEGGTYVSLGDTPTNIPTTSMVSRTGIIITNTSSNNTKRIHCVPGGTPSATVGKLIYPANEHKWEGAQAGWVLSCICVSSSGTLTTGCTYQVEEERCYQ